MSRAALVATRWRFLRELLGERDLARLFLTVGLWAIVDSAFLLAVSVTAYQLGGAGAVGLVGAVRVLPAAVTSSAAALLADRIHRPRLIGVVSVSCAVVSLAMAATVAAGSGLAVLVAVQAVGSAVSGWARPSMQALVPQLVRQPQRLLPSGAAWSFLNGAGTVLGPAGAAILLAAWGTQTVFVVVAVLYVVTGAVAATIRTPFQPSRHSGSARGWLQTRHWSAGLDPFRAPGGRAFFAVFMVQRAMSGLVTAFVVIYAHEAISGVHPDAVSGALLSAVGLGGLLGAVVALATSGRLRWWYAGGVTITGLPFALAGLTDRLSLAGAALVATGAGSALSGIYASALLNRWLPDHLAGRAWGALLGLGAIATAAGSLVVPVLSSGLGVGPAMVAVGLLASITPLVAVPALRALETRITPPPEILALLTGVRPLASLPDLFLSRLACVAVSHEVGPGEAVVRQGDDGEDFYVVQSGELQVVRDGVEVRRLGPGDSFGEVALLRTTPRTATVLAVSPSTLVSLGHDAFVHIVTGHGPTDEWVESAVSGLLAEDERRTDPA